MLTPIQVTVHASQFPQSVREGLRAGLRSCRIPSKFHYQSYKQAQLWLALHRACSPAWLDAEATTIYDRSFVAAAVMQQQPVTLIGLGCGNGYKEARLLSRLGDVLTYLPCDVSLPLLLDAARAAKGSAGNIRTSPLLCDLALADDLPEFLGNHSAPNSRRIITFFGMIPNLEPDNILPKLAQLVRKDDLLLMSANLAPGGDYLTGVKRVLPGYDNAQTRAWLLAFLYDLGIEAGDGAVDFSIEENSGLYWIVADFRFLRERILTVDEEQFIFASGDVLRLFYSYRHTPNTLAQWLKAHRLEIVEQWITTSQEEGVFLCRKQPG
jgi:L-histidine N-alpha-methyltransferase